MSHVRWPLRKTLALVASTLEVSDCSRPPLIEKSDESTLMSDESYMAIEARMSSVDCEAAEKEACDESTMKPFESERVDAVAESVALSLIANEPPPMLVVELVVSESDEFSLRYMEPPVSIKVERFETVIELVPWQAIEPPPTWMEEEAMTCIEAESAMATSPLESESELLLEINMVLLSV